MGNVVRGGAVTNVAWWSEDGVNWNEAETTQTIVPYRGFPAIAAFGGRLWVLGGFYRDYTSSGQYGNYFNDVWVADPVARNAASPAWLRMQRD